MRKTCCDHNIEFKFCYARSIDKPILLDLAQDLTLLFDVQGVRGVFEVLKSFSYFWFWILKMETLFGLVLKCFLFDFKSKVLILSLASSYILLISHTECLKEASESKHKNSTTNNFKARHPVVPRTV